MTDVMTKPEPESVCASELDPEREALATPVTEGLTLGEIASLKSDAVRDPQTGQWVKGTLVAIRKGEVRNRTGRPKGVFYIKDALARLLRMPMTDVYAVYTNPEETAAFRIAAGRIILAMTCEDDRSDTAFNQVADRTEGKPAQSTHVVLEEKVDVSRLIADINERYAVLARPAERNEMTLLNILDGAQENENDER